MARVRLNPDVMLTEGRTVLLFVAAWYEPCAQISQVLRALAAEHGTIKFVQVRACVCRIKLRVVGFRILLLTPNSAPPLLFLHPF